MTDSKRIELKSPREIERIRRAGLVVWTAHQAAARRVEPGVSTSELNDSVRQALAAAGAEPLFLNYPGVVPFPAESCISVNEELVHGIPGPRRLKEGDIVSIDIGARYQGWCGDAAVTHAVGAVNSVARRLLSTTAESLDLAIQRLASAKYWSEVARDIQDFIQSRGFHVVDSMVGHGIGRDMHEPPQVPNCLTERWTQAADFVLRPGLVLAIEPMVNVGTPRLECLPDHWTLISADRKLAAHFEHTVALTSQGPIRLTAAPSPQELNWVPEEFRDPRQWIQW